MNSNGRWKTPLLVLLIVLLALGAVRILTRSGPDRVREPVDVSGAPEQQVEVMVKDVSSYFPAFLGLTYHYAGEGMEFAAFTRRITYASGGLLQVEDLSGTNLARVYEVSDSQLKVLWSREEFYSRDSLLDDFPQQEAGPGRLENLILLQTPLEIGNSWEDALYRREIAGVDEVLTVPMGTFHGVVVVKSTPLAEPVPGEESVTYEYYAQNMGLIKRETLFTAEGDTYSVVSQLEGVTSNVYERR